ncbi:MAG TPA: hypothetical protein VMW48_11490, partial [Vicinamibacterales bacterium]|nr:hypothetical protein [Vicinamibacterales bacterium]
MRGALGRSGRKRSRRAARFLGGQGGFLTASTVMAAVGVAWGLYDSLRGPEPAVAGPSGAIPMSPPASGPIIPSPAPAPGGPPPLLMPPDVARVVRLAASAASADGHIADDERALIRQHARQAGVAELV